jgi:hypothetical protein
VLQKKAIRIITFSLFDEHSSPIFKRLRLIKLSDLITLLMTMFMYKFHNCLLPLNFNDYFAPVQLQSYNTRLASGLCLSLPKPRVSRCGMHSAILTKYCYSLSSNENLKLILLIRTNILKKNSESRFYIISLFFFLSFWFLISYCINSFYYYSVYLASSSD